MDTTTATRRQMPVPSATYVNGIEACAMCEATHSSKWHRSTRHGVLVCRVCQSIGAYERHYVDFTVVRVPAANSRPLPASKQEHDSPLAEWSAYLDARGVVAR